MTKFRVAKTVICNEPGCRVLTEGKYCDAHQSKRKADPRTERDRFLDSRAWRKLSKAKLAETPWCEICLKSRGVYNPARDVDHIIPRSEAPERRLDPTNLQSLCKRCHSAKTGRGK